MRWCIALALGCLVGCGPEEEPPPEPPSVRIKSPEHRVTLGLSNDCRLEIPVTVDIQGLDLIDAERTGGNVDGQGHWHLQVDELEIHEVSQTETTLTETGILPGARLIVRASAQRNDHSDYDDGPDWEDSVEVLVVDAATTSCI